MLASAPAEHYRRALSTLLRDENVDSVLTIFIPPLVTEPDAVAAAMSRPHRRSKGSLLRGYSCAPPVHPRTSWVSPATRFRSLPGMRSHEWRPIENGSVSLSVSCRCLNASIDATQHASSASRLGVVVAG